MSFIDKDQRITSWQTKNKHDFIETSVTSSFLSSFFPSRLELFCSTADVSCVNKQAMYLSLISFFLPPRFVYISVSPNCSELAFVLGFNVKFGPTCLPLFSSHRPLVELLMLRRPTKSSCFLEDIRVLFDCKQQITTKH